LSGVLVLEESRAVVADVQPAVETVRACRLRMLLHECRQQRQTSVRLSTSALAMSATS
jgi:hypothetical protein